MKHLYCLMALMLSLPEVLSSQNPVINHCFTADPTARVFNDKIYMYPSHDIVSPVERLKEWFAWRTIMCILQKTLSTGRTTA